MIEVKASDIETKLLAALEKRGWKNKITLGAYDIAEVFNMDEKTINKLAKEGKLVAINFSEKANGKNVFFIDDVIKFIVSTTIKNRNNKSN